MLLKTLNLEHANIYTAEGDPTDESFEIWGAFYGVVPVDDNTPEARAQDLNTKVVVAINSRLGIFSKLLNLALRQESLQPWQEIDVALTALATMLEGKGLHGALDTIKPAVARIGGLAGGNGPSH